MQEYAEQRQEEDLGPQEPPEAEVRAHARASTTRCSRRRAACARSAASPGPRNARCTSTTITTTGAIRGLLCFTCNNALGDFRDEPELLPRRGRVPGPGRRARGARAQPRAGARRRPDARHGARRAPPVGSATDVRPRVAAVLARTSIPARRSPTCCGRSRPHQLPGRGHRRRHGAPIEVTHGTTVLAIRFAGGVVMAGDRRATAGYTIASRRIEKVFPADDFSGVAIAGAAGPAVEMVQAVPDPARALREGAGRRAQPRRQGEPARPDGAGQPARRDAGLRGGAALRGLRRRAAAAAASSPTTSPAAGTRRSTTRRRARAACTPATGSRPAGART